MSIDKLTVEYTAHLARIELGDKELDKLSKQLDSILDFINTLKKVSIEGVPPTSHALPINNVLRDDSQIASLPAEKTFSNAPGRKNNFFIVPKVIE